ncbi:uncharacterized protein EI90DRAFT_3025225 [Cantharellus anzutake]|uniref:uncharacterized protein n=1 Tax=Cantharellus anzutake TaxID=1750568 RepID=UPI0019045306|nr:uncharacterized protein EI90DRAFT_3025225 [Cantharellus anzutake]KAF8309319.1 hypothetical protein EI90DRAFT_3025225 [Cantharellus anzutake]
MSYWPSQFSDYGSINATQNQPEKQDPKVTKETYNRRIQELKRKFEEDVNVIANEFSGRHVHHSAAQIRGQILYTMAEDKKTRSPHISNAWAHATADVGRLDTESFTDMPYDTAYMDLLRDIKAGVVTQEDVGDPQTPEDEYNHKLLLDAVLVSRQHRTAKRHIISPELSAHRLALHAKDQLQKTATRIHETCGIEVLIMMTKSRVEDVFTPYVWATPRAKEYWVVGAAQNMTSRAQEMEGFCISNIRGMAKVAEETIKELRTRLAGLTTDRLYLPGSAAKDKFVGMKWEKEGYLQLVSGLKLKIDSYPFDEIKAPKWLRKAELMKLIEGWEHGSIKWVTASNDEIESAQQELSRLAREKVDCTVNRRQSATNKANSSTSTPDMVLRFDSQNVHILAFRFPRPRVQIPTWWTFYGSHRAHPNPVAATRPDKVSGGVAQSTKDPNPAASDHMMWTCRRLAGVTAHGLLEARWLGSHVDHGLNPM